MESNSAVLILVCVGFVIIMGGMVGLAVYLGLQSKKKSEQLAQELGLSPITDPQPFIERLSFLYEVPPDRLRLHFVVGRKGLDFDSFLFDLYHYHLRHSRRKLDDRLLEKSAVAFTSPKWKFPRIITVRRLSGQGKFASLANQAADKLADAVSQSVQFPHIPGLDERYRFSVFNADPAWVSLPDGFLRILASGPDLNLHLGGDTFTVSHAGLTGQTPTEEQVRELYSLAVRLANELRS
jgi:hypothetical protein